MQYIVPGGQQEIIGCKISSDSHYIRQWVMETDMTIGINQGDSSSTSVIPDMIKSTQEVQKAKNAIMDLEGVFFSILLSKYSQT